MRILPQFTMFDQTQNIEVLGDLERFRNIVAIHPKIILFILFKYFFTNYSTSVILI